MIVIASEAKQSSDRRPAAGLDCFVGDASSQWRFHL